MLRARHERLEADSGINAAFSSLRLLRDLCFAQPQDDYALEVQTQAQFQMQCTSLIEMEVEHAFVASLGITHPVLVLEPKLQHAWTDTPLGRGQLAIKG